MSKNFPLRIAGLIFLVVAIFHMLRLILQSELVLNGAILPMWLSWLGLIISLSLAVWMFLASRH